MKTIKTSELTGAALDWSVCVANGETREEWLSNPYSYSTNWIFGGPLIEREGITVSKEEGRWSAYFRDNLFEDDGSEHWQTGPTPLIAVMRCYVASKLGNTVEVPEELLK